MITEQSKRNKETKQRRRRKYPQLQIWRPAANGDTEQGGRLAGGILTGGGSGQHNEGWRWPGFRPKSPLSLSLSVPHSHVSLSHSYSHTYVNQLARRPPRSSPWTFKRRHGHPEFRGARLTGHGEADAVPRGAFASKRRRDNHAKSHHQTTLSNHSKLST